ERSKLLASLGGSANVEEMRALDELAHDRLGAENKHARKTCEISALRAGSGLPSRTRLGRVAASPQFSPARKTACCFQVRWHASWRLRGLRVPDRAIWPSGRPTKKQTIGPTSSIPTFSPSSMPIQSLEPMARS